MALRVDEQLRAPEPGERARRRGRFSNRGGTHEVKQKLGAQRGLSGAKGVATVPGEDSEKIVHQRDAAGHDVLAAERVERQVRRVLDGTREQHRRGLRGVELRLAYARVERLKGLDGVRQCVGQDVLVEPIGQGLGRCAQAEERHRARCSPRRRE